MTLQYAEEYSRLVETNRVANVKDLGSGHEGAEVREPRLVFHEKATSILLHRTCQWRLPEGVQTLNLRHLAHFGQL